MKELHLNEVIRYGLAGAVGLLALVAICPEVRSLVSSDASFAEGALIAGISLTWGIVAYTLHRAVAYPILYRIVLIPYLWQAGLRWRMLVPYWSWQEEVERDHRRWEASDTEKAALRDWAAQVHFLYCSAWVLLSAWPLALIFCCEAESSLIGTRCALLAIIFAVAAFVHHARYTRAETAWLASKSTNNRVQSTTKGGRG